MISHSTKPSDCTRCLQPTQLHCSTSRNLVLSGTLSQQSVRFFPEDFFKHGTGHNKLPPSGRYSLPKIPAHRPAQPSLFCKEPPVPSSRRPAGLRFTGNRVRVNKNFRVLKKSAVPTGSHPQLSIVVGDEPLVRSQMFQCGGPAEPNRVAESAVTSRNVNPESRGYAVHLCETAQEASADVSNKTAYFKFSMVESPPRPADIQPTRYRRIAVRLKSILHDNLQPTCGYRKRLLKSKYGVGAGSAAAQVS